MFVRTLFHLASVETLFHLFLLECCSNSELTEQNIIYNPATPLQGSTDISQVATISGTSVNQASMEYLGRRQKVVVGGTAGHNFRKETSVTPSHQLEYRENIQVDLKQFN